MDTEAAARAISPIVGPATSVLSLQNGVQKDDVLRHIIGDRPILGGDLLHLSDDRSARGNQPYRHRPEDRVRRIRRTTFGASRSFS